MTKGSMSGLIPYPFIFSQAARMRSRARGPYSWLSALGTVAGCAADFVPRSAVPLELVEPELRFRN